MASKITRLQLAIKNNVALSLALTALVFCGLGNHFASQGTSSGAEQHLATYRVVYLHSTRDSAGKCNNEEGYFWYTQILTHDGIFGSHWGDLLTCNADRDKAIKSAQIILKRKLDAEISKQTLYDAYKTQKDTIEFKKR